MFLNPNGSIRVNPTIFQVTAHQLATLPLVKHYISRSTVLPDDFMKSASYLV